MRRWPVFLLLVSPAVLLVSLYLPWQRGSCGTSPVTGFQSTGGATAGLPNLFAGSCPSLDGWSSVGEVTAIAALVLFSFAVFALAQADLRDRLPFLQSGLLLSYFVVAVVAETRLSAQQAADYAKAISGTPTAFHFAYGTYIGVAAGTATLVGTAFLARERLSSRPSAHALAGIVAALALPVSLLLPWMRSGLTPATRQTLLGIETSPGVITAVLALLLVVACWNEKAGCALERLGLAIGTLIFAGATLATNFPAIRAYGSWIGLGLGITLLLATLSRENWASIPHLERPQWVLLIASAVLITSLFLPWQTACYGNTATFRALRLSGRCVSTNGFDLIGTLSAALACAIATTVLIPRFRRTSVLELAVALALFVATLGFRLEDGTDEGVRLGFGYGSIIGFTAAGLLLLLALTTVNSWKLDLRQLVWRVPGILLCLAYIAVTVVAWWGVLPNNVWTVFNPALWKVSWLTAAGALIGMRLLTDWTREPQDRRYETLILPCALAAQAILITVPFPHVRLTWDGGLLLGLSLALIILGLVESRAGFRNLRVPEILRFDRI